MATHGGKRNNAGRPRGKGKYGESTIPMRIPKSRVTDVTALLSESSCSIPLYSSKVQAGFPSPADDHIEAYLDLNNHLVPNPAATFMVRAEGESMLNAGIHSGDILIVDRSIKATNHKIVIAAIDGELTVKRLNIKESEVWLMPENDDFQPINITGQDTVIWGVVTNVIHSL